MPISYRNPKKFHLLSVNANTTISHYKKQKNYSMLTSRILYRFLRPSVTHLRRFFSKFCEPISESQWPPWHSDTPRLWCAIFFATMRQLRHTYGTRIEDINWYRPSHLRTILADFFDLYFCVTNFPYPIYIVEI